MLTVHKEKGGVECFFEEKLAHSPACGDGAWVRVDGA
jgi:hypothetical protein